MGWHFGCDVGLVRQLTVWSHVVGFARRKVEEGIVNKEVLHRK